MAIDYTKLPVYEQKQLILDSLKNNQVIVVQSPTGSGKTTQIPVILHEAGYERYEISNYSKKGCECRHNIGYWERTPYVGFGIGAASLFEETRYANPSDIEEYRISFKKKFQAEKLSIEEQMEEFMFLGLRMMKGI